MALNLENKKEIVAQVKEASEKALSAVIADSRGVTVEKMTELRKTAREAGVSLRVVRNTLLRRALKDTPFNQHEAVLTGPSLLAFSNEHPGAAARIFEDFAKENKNFEIKGAIFEGKFISSNNISSLSSLPTYDEAIARLLGTIKEAAAGKLARTLEAYRLKLENGDTAVAE